MLVIASRGSQLALWQARWVAAQLSAAGHHCRIETFKTTGDKITDVPLAKVGTKGLFTKEIEEALLGGRADLAVHSLKDLPTELPEGLVLAAVPQREDPRDAVVGRKLAELPPGARVGTSSLRRAAQLRQLRPDLQVESVRGNTRPSGFAMHFYSNGRENTATKFTVDNMRQQFASFPNIETAIVEQRTLLDTVAPPSAAE